MLGGAKGHQLTRGRGSLANTGRSTLKIWNLALLLIDAVLLVACSDSTTGLGYTPGKGGGGTGGSSGADSGEGTAALQVMTHNGPVKGTMTGATRAFLGIPYAQSPIGDLRWRSP